MRPLGYFIIAVISVFLMVHVYKIDHTNIVILEIILFVVFEFSLALGLGKLIKQNKDANR